MSLQMNDSTKSLKFWEDIELKRPRLLWSSDKGDNRNRIPKKMNPQEWSNDALSYVVFFFCGTNSTTDLWKKIQYSHYVTENSY